MAKATKESFEDALKQLEIIVKKLEAGEMPLEESLKAFEEGIKLASLCAQKLAEAQRRVEMLINKNGVPTSLPWSEVEHE
jgi:exodeoxyribonuclease VII small subunit